MEITSVEGNWTKSNFSGKEIFIVNKALIEKLCILGENVEPCFEGAQIKETFSLETLEGEFKELKNTIFSMMNELTEALSKGGSTEKMDEVTKIEEAVEVAEEEVVAVNEDVEADTADPIEEFKSEEEKEDEKEEDTPDNSEEDTDEESAEDKKEDKKKYDLADVVEYFELKAQYEELVSKYNDLQAELAPLQQFKIDRDREDKTAMINSFAMLSDEDKAEIVKNIDTYSLDDIEAKLCVMCYRKNINFNLDIEETEEKETSAPTVFKLDSADSFEPDVPAWVKAVKETEVQM